MSNTSFNEEKYLAANPDVAAAVRAGGVHSGHEHYLKYGKNEGRSLSPLEINKNKKFDLIHNLTFKYEYLFPLIAKLPQRLAYRLVSFYNKIPSWNQSIQREQIVRQMKRVFIDHSDEQLKLWANYFLSMQEREKLDTNFFQNLTKDTQLDNFIRLHHHQELITAHQQGRKILITSGHFGRLWMVGIGLRRHGITVSALTRDSISENLQQLPEAEFNYRVKKLKALQQHFGGPFFVEGASVRPIYHALEQHVMALLIDVPQEKSKSGCIELPFLGRMTRFPVGIAKIAKKTNALIVPYYVFESRDGLDINFYPGLNAKDLEVTEIMQHLVTLLEKQILVFPEQWWHWSALPVFWEN